jgi:hypothetical protein
MLIAALNVMYADAPDTVVGFSHVLDNAPYHRSAAPECIPIESLRRRQ